MDISRFIEQINPLPSYLYEKYGNINFFDIYKVILEHAHFLYNQSSIKNNVILDNFIDGVLFSSKKILESTLIFEINYMRINKLISGKSEYDKYIDFNNKIMGSKNGLFYKYPVALELICNDIKSRISNYEVILEKFEKDKMEITNKYNNIDITDMKILGDPHKNGESVTKVTLKQEENFIEILYKPRDMTMDLHFQNLLQWFNDNTELYDFKTIKIINKKNYGWMEFIKSKPCHNKNEINCYFERQGYYLALFYIVNATDMHNENIIANGEFPVYVDLETIFHNQSYYNEIANNANDKGQRLVSTSLYSSNILPISISNKRFENFNFSALNETKGKVTTIDIVDPFTSKIKMVKVKKDIAPNNKHLPSIDNNTIDGENYAFQIIKGFKAMMNIILSKKQFFQSTYSPFSPFKGGEFRQVIRPTYFYGRLIEGAHSPEYLQNEGQRRRFFEKLYNLDYHHLPKSILEKEISFLINDNIPVFSSQSDSLKLEIDGERIEDFYSFSSYDLTIDKIKSLNKESINKQIKLIVGSLDAYRNGAFLENPNRNLLESVFIGEDINKEKIISKNESSVTWNTFVFNRYGNLNYETMKLDLYSGLLGLLLYYGQLYIHSGEIEFLKTSKQIIQTIQLEFEYGNYNDISLYNGLAGIVFVVSQLDFLLKDKNVSEFLDTIIETIKTQYHMDKEYDLIGGNAGVIISLVAYYKRSKDDSLLEFLNVIYTHLLSDREINNYGRVYWPSSYLDDVTPKNGFAHGNIGIAYSMFKLFEITNSEEMKKEIQYICDNETLILNSIYDDNYQFKNQDYNWCNGLLGIYVAYELINEKIPIEFPKIFSSLKESIKEFDIKLDPCLCHGFVGAHDLICTLSRKSVAIDLTNLQSQMNEKIKYQENWWSNQAGKFNRMHGLMTGDAGVGYHLLRLFDNQTPDVLMFSNI